MAKVTKKPTVRFSQKAYQQMWALTEACPIEISAMGIIATEEQKKSEGITEDFYVLEYFVIDQECTGTSTDLDDDAFIDLVMKLRDRGISAEQIVVWWHSHVRMGVSHSGTDEAQIERFDFDTVCISAITNKKNELNLRVDMYKPFRHTFEKCDHTVDELDILPNGWAKDMVETHVTHCKVIPQRLDVIKAKGVATKRTKNNYSNGFGYSTNQYSANQYISQFQNDWTSGWKELDDDAEAEPAEVEEATTDIPYEYLDEVKFPKELQLLQSAWDAHRLETQDAMELFARWYAKELSDQEVAQELAETYNILETDFIEEEEEEDGHASVAVVGV